MKIVSKTLLVSGLTLGAIAFATSSAAAYSGNGQGPANAYGQKNGSRAQQQANANVDSATRQRLREDCENYSEEERLSRRANRANANNGGGNYQYGQKNS